ncbi:MAG: pro-sigmaK processing inhibitor BofA family protein [Suilimivivens sp.]
MSTYSGILWIAGALAAVLMIGAFRNHAEMIINFILRGVLGMMMIYFVNYFLSGRIPGMELGYNPLTFCTTGLLGIPGILMLYGINLYMIL